ncbi:MAG: fibronectin type III domain-containing protein, partial [Pyrinomonadaceae bacterium]
RADNDPLHPGVVNPAQQGVVCLIGTTCPSGPPDTRNLLDFNELTVDSAGRVTAVYADGCNFDHPCIGINDNSADRTGNQGVARITIIRQRGGTRLFRAFDPPPGPPSNTFVEAQPAQKGVQVLWGTPATNGAPIREYRVYRGSAGKPERLVSTTGPSTNTIVDKQGKPGDYYQVTAVNSYGESRKAVKAVVRRKQSNARTQGGK